VFPDLVKDIFPDYRKFYEDCRLVTHNTNMPFVGDFANYDEDISSNSNKLQKFKTQIYNKSNDFHSVYSSFYDDQVEFEDKENNKTNYIIGRQPDFSFYFTILLMDFAQMNGFEILIRNLSPEENATLDLINLTFYIVDKCCHLFHIDYIKQIGPKIQTNIFKFLNEMSLDQLRNIKKETLESILKVLRFLLSKNLDNKEMNSVLEKFSLNFSLRMIKTDFFDKRKQAVTNLADIIRASKGNPEKRKEILAILEENQIFYVIFNRNSHHQIILLSKEILEILLQENKISDNEIETICAGIKTVGHIEEKLTILKLLNEVSLSLSEKHVNLILNLIYSANLQIQELHKEEIDLIYSLSTHYTQGPDNLIKCINFFVSWVLSSKETEGEKINNLINKIYEITAKYPKFKTDVINLCTQSLEKVCLIDYIFNCYFDFIVYLFT